MAEVLGSSWCSMETKVKKKKVCMHHFNGRGYDLSRGSSDEYFLCGSEDISPTMKTIKEVKSEVDRSRPNKITKKLSTLKVHIMCLSILCVCVCVCLEIASGLFAHIL